MLALYGWQNEFLVSCANRGAGSIHSRANGLFAPRFGLVLFLALAQLLTRQRNVLPHNYPPRSVKMVERDADDRLRLSRNTAGVFHYWVKRQERFFAVAVVKLQGLIVYEHAASNTHIQFDAKFDE